MAASDGKVVVNVIADRPDTLYLLRRNIDLLAQDFREIGYRETAFSFSGNASGGAGAGPEQQGRAEPVPAGSAADPDTTDPGHADSPAPPFAAEDRVDIRL